MSTEFVIQLTQNTIIKNNILRKNCIHQGKEKYFKKLRPKLGAWATDARAVLAHSFLDPCPETVPFPTPNSKRIQNLKIY
jgi:hypothetical protein